MKTMTALIRREYLEHRGPFVYAPAVILAILTMILVGSVVGNRFHIAFEVRAPTALRFFEFGFLALCGLWSIYLLAALFFYYADAFNADRRNNGMLFWKSMPVSDFQVLSAKMLAGMTAFPALVYLAALLSGVLMVAATVAAANVLPQLALPGPLDFLASAWGVGSFALVFLVLALLWYAPFFAWVGALSTLVGRWSIPLAFLIPGLVGLAEQMIVGRVGSGVVLTYLRERLHFFHPDEVATSLWGGGITDGRLLAELLGSIDWVQMAGGLIFAALAVYAASEYRRRVVAM